MAFTNDPSPFRDGPQDVKTAIESLRPLWGWIVALGGLIAGMGVAALILVVSATIASVYTIAIFMILAGAAEIATGLSAKTWDRFLLWIFAGLAYIVVAAFSLAQPLVAAAFFHFGARRWNDRHRGGPDLPRGASRCSLARPCSACGRAYGVGGSIDCCGLAGE